MTTFGEALDRYITGNYGEDNNFEWGDKCGKQFPLDEIEDENAPHNICKKCAGE